MKALLFGGYDVPYHPLTDVAGLIEFILSPEFQITIATRNDILMSDLTIFDMIISYADQWDKGLTPGEAAGLVRFVAGGGGLLVIHNGICLASRHEIKSMIGASFTGHPKAEVLSFEFVGPNSITEGIEPFSIHEEPYQYDFCTHMNHKIFMSYRYRGTLLPSGWTVEYGLGKVVYLHPGHGSDAFKCESYQKVLYRSALWCVGNLD